MKGGHMRKKLSILLILVMLTAVLTPLLPPAVSEQGPLSLLTTEAEAASIKLNHSSVVIPMRMYKKLEVKGTSKKVTWSSSKASVAAVSSTGIVTANKTGSATIKAKVAGKTLRCKVTVIDRHSPKQVGKLVLKKVEKYYSHVRLIGYDRDDYKIRALINRPVGAGAPGMVVKVDIKTGKAVCESGWKDYFPSVPRKFTLWSCKKTARVSKITLNRTTVSVEKGLSISLKATVSPSNATNKEVIWKSSNNKIATVSGDGLVKGITEGTAKITASAADGSGKKAVCQVSVITPAAGVKYINDLVLRSTGANAAKHLGLKVLTKKGTMLYYSKKKGNVQSITALETTTSSKNKPGMWDLSIRDNTITLFGARLGMNLSDTLIFLNKCKYMNPVDPDEVDRIKQAKNGELCYEYYDEVYNNFAIIDMTIRDNRLVGIDILKNLN